MNGIAETSSAISGSTAQTLRCRLISRSFSHLYEVPPDSALYQPGLAAGRRAVAGGRNGSGRLVSELLDGQTIVPLIHHWLLIQGQRSMRGLR